MVEIPVRVAEDLSTTGVKLLFEQSVQLLGLASKEMSLKAYPGSTHWHVTMPKAKGTIEATWWPKKRRFWLSVHANRGAEWQDRFLVLLRSLMEHDPFGES